MSNSYLLCFSLLRLVNPNQQVSLILKYVKILPKILFLRLFLGILDTNSLTRNYNLSDKLLLFPITTDFLQLMANSFNSTNYNVQCVFLYMKSSLFPQQSQGFFFYFIFKKKFQSLDVFHGIVFASILMGQGFSLLKISCSL